MPDRADGEWVDESIRLVPYDHSWPAAFLTESSQLNALIGTWISGGIHHVGSTAIPGMTAKPVIDILGGVRSLQDSRPSLKVLQEGRLVVLAVLARRDALVLQARTFTAHPSPASGAHGVRALSL